MNSEKLTATSGWRALVASYERKGLHPILIVIAMALLFLPFCNKALHIDDYGFLQMSKALSWNPLAPVSPWVLDTTHPLLIPYLYKILFTLTGANEILLHLVFLIFPLIAVFSLRSLNRTFFRPDPNQELVLLVLFCSIPAFFVNAQNLMADVPALAFVLLALASYSAAMEADTPRLAYVGGCSLCIALFISYQTAVFIPIIFIYALAKKKLRPDLLMSLAIAPVIMLAWLLCVYQRYDVFPFLKGAATTSGTATPSAIAKVVADGFPLEALKGKLVFLLAMTGASMLPALVCRLLAPEHSLGIWLFGILCSASLAALSFVTPGYDLLSRVLLSLSIAGGLVALVMVFSHGITDFCGANTRGRGSLLLMWVGAVLLYNLWLLPFGSARYLLPALPPILMILCNRLEFSSPIKRAAACSIIVFALFFAQACAVADYRHADSYRSMATEVKEFRVASGNNFDVWFVGDWGMGYYMTKVGARLLPPDSNEPKRGDFIVLPEMPRFTVPSPQVQARSRNYATREFVSSFPLRIFNRSSKAGFYSHYAGLLPFSLSRDPDETFIILEVMR